MQLSLRIGVLKETDPDERRVSIVPESVKKAVALGMRVSVERGAGDMAYFSSQDYSAAGAEIVDDRKKLVSGSDIIVTVQRPGEDDIAAMRPGTVVIGLIYPYMYPETVRSLSSAGVDSFSLELMPRTTRAQMVDVLSSQASVSGYRAAMIGAYSLPLLVPMLTTAAGTVRPGKALVIGAGVAGLMAIATLKRLGASVSAFDVRRAAGEDVRSLGARFLETSFDAVGAGGYARDLTDTEIKEQQSLISGAVKDSDLVLTTAGVPGKPAPKIVTGEMVRSMRGGSVIVDVAAESGGNCEITRKGEDIDIGGVTVLGPANLPAEVPKTASEMFSRNMLSYIVLLIDDTGDLKLDLSDELVSSCLVTKDGRIMSPGNVEK